ncbi:HypC/HybG/HupF family hydrogenase formation chaperone [Magnetovibrio sp.]|uniref:HypC/HybG/HupF family hydrogenase formation chaperone n=1 Tax=Magnetovibrio sp. TaxID=2024836 RepID=UPI002F92697D
MCHAIPAKVVALRDDGMAEVELEGVIKEASLDLLDGVELGDYVILHVGYALAKLDPDEAQKTLKLFAEMGAAALAEGAVA